MAHNYTIKNFIESQEPRLIYLHKGIPQDFKSLSRVEQGFIQNRGCYDLFYVVRKDEGGFCYAHYQAVITKGPSGYFVKSQEMFSLRIVNNRIYTSGCMSTDDLRRLGVNLFDESFDELITVACQKNKTFLRAVLTGKVYNKETLTKRIYSSFLGIKVPDWRIGFELISHLDGNILHYILIGKNHCTNLAEFLKALLQYVRGPYDDLQLFRDTLDMAYLLDEKINPKWSVKRLSLEHRRQIERYNSLLSDSELVSKEKIHTTPVEGADIKQINSESDILQEALKMSNCLYSNYRHGILHKEYLAFHLNNPEDVTFGVRYGKIGYEENYSAYLEQAHTVNNGKPSAQSMKIIKDFIEIHNEELRNLFACNHKVATQKADEEELPF